MAALVSVRFDASDLKALSDPAMMARAESMMIERAVEILQPIARTEAPSRTGKGRGMILGAVDRRAGHPLGRVHAGKAFWLRILATGATAHDITPFRFKAKSRARRAAKALGPGRARGAIRALRFQLGGGVLFRGAVHHPGLKANPWMERAARLGEPAVETAGDVVVQAALDRATHG